VSTDDHTRSTRALWYRRLRRWARHTPNGDIAMSLMGAGAFLAVLAVVLGFFVF
jgi:hypothetical protein